MEKAAAGASPAENAPALRMKIGQTTYTVAVHFKEDGAGTFEEKIRYLIQREVEKM